MNKCDKCKYCEYEFDEIKLQEVPTDCALGYRNKFESENDCERFIGADMRGCENE